MVMTGVYTDAERRSIEAGAAAYDERCERQLQAEREKQESIEKGVDLPAMTRKALDDETMERIRDLQEDIALLVSLRETFPDNESIQERVKITISMVSSLIRANYEELANR